MANITGLTEATYPFNGTEYKEVIQSGNSRKALDWNGVETLTGSAAMTSGNRLILLNAASGTVTVPTTVPVGQDVEFIKIHASAGTWTGERSGSETFAGATSFTLTEQYERQVWTKVTTTRWERKLWSLGAQEYETGTFTPEYIPETGAFGGVTYFFQTGYYVKMGSMVFITVVLRTDSITVGTASGYVEINLPFTSANLSVSQGVTLGVCENFGVNNPRGGIVVNSAPRLRLYYRATANGSDAALAVSDLSTSNNNLLRTNFSYLAA